MKTLHKHFDTSAGHISIIFGYRFDPPVRQHSFMEIGHEIIFTAILPLLLTRGARWLSGRVSDSGARGRGFETYLCRVVSLSKTLYSPKVLVAPSRHD